MKKERVCDVASFKTDLQKMLRNVRLACGFTQGEVAKVLEVNRSTYTYYESGRTSPDLRALRRLAALYRIPVAAFLSPEEYAGMEIGRVKMRSEPCALPDPQCIGELTTEEKQLVEEFRLKKERELYE